MSNSFYPPLSPSAFLSNDCCRSAKAIFCSIVGRRVTRADEGVGSMRMVDAACGEGCGRNPVVGDVDRDGTLSISLSDEMLLDVTMVNCPVLLVLMRLT